MQVPTGPEHRHPLIHFSLGADGWRRMIMGKGILLWLIGIPIPVIIILWLLFR
ncbi:hypothetical protein [Sphingobium sp. TomTYG75]